MTEAGTTSVTLEQLQKERLAAVTQVASKIAQVQEELKAMRTTTASMPDIVAEGAGPPSQDGLSKFLGARKKTLPADKGAAISATTSSSATDSTSKVYKERKRLLVGPKQRTAMDEMDTLLALNAFRDKLRRVEDPLRPSLGKQEKSEPEPAPQLDICKLHGLVSCQSCRDTFGRGETAGPGTEEGWLMHRLVFDREVGYRELRSDLDQLQVIDPRARAGAAGESEKKKKNQES